MSLKKRLRLSVHAADPPFPPFRLSGSSWPPKAEILYTPGKCAANVAALACTSPARGGTMACKVCLFMAAKAGAPKPQLGAPEVLKDLEPQAEAPPPPARYACRRVFPQLLQTAAASAGAS